MLMRISTPIDHVVMIVKKHIPNIRFSLQQKWRHQILHLPQQMIDLQLQQQNFNVDRVNLSNHRLSIEGAKK